MSGSAVATVHPTGEAPLRQLAAAHITDVKDDSLLRLLVGKEVVFVLTFDVPACKCCGFKHVVEDGVTRRLRGYVANWHPVAGLSDDALAQTIRADGIDILIDLSAHTAHNRLLTFARKPVPVQATWIGYPGTTGLPWTISICDRFNAPLTRRRALSGHRGTTS